VYGRPGDEDLGLDAAGVLWAPWWALPVDAGAWPAAEGGSWVGGAEDAATVAQAYVAWRDYASVLLMRAAAVARFVWLHDVYQSDMGAAAALEAATDGYLVLSEQHARQLPGHLAHKVLVTRNGVPEVFFEAGRAVQHANLTRNEPQRFVYASMPSRGLLYVLQAWPTIHACMARAGRNASLDVYYGFTEHDQQRAAQDPAYRSLVCVSFCVCVWCQDLLDLQRGGSGQAEEGQAEEGQAEEGQAE